MDGDPGDPARLLTRNFALGWVATVALYLSHHLVLPTFPLYVEQLTGEAATAGLLNGALMAATGVGTLSIPWLMGRFGRKSTLLLGLGLIASVALYPALEAAPELLAVTIVRGLGFGIGNAALLTVIVDTVPSARRGQGLGAYQIAVSLGGLMGAGGGVYLWERYGFPTVAFPAAAILVPAILVIVATVGLLGRTTGGRPKEILDTLRRLPQLQGPTLIFALLTFSYGGIVTFGALHVRANALGSAVVFFFVNSGAQVVARPLAGWLCDRLHPQVVLTGSIALTMTGLVTLAFAGGPISMVVGAAFFGLGFGAGVISSQMVLMERLGAAERPLASAMFGVAYSWGMGAGAGTLALIVGLAGYRGLFVVMAAVGGVALALAAARAQRLGVSLRTPAPGS